MRAILKSASKQKSLALVEQRQRKAFANALLYCCERYSSNFGFRRHFSTNALAGLDENHDDHQLAEGALSQAGFQVRINRLSNGFRSGEILSTMIVKDMKDLAEGGATIPTSFLFDAVEVLAGRREAHIMEVLLKLIQENSKDSRRSSSYEFDKLAAFGIRKMLRHSTADALTLWTNLTENGFKISRSDLTEMLREIADSEDLPEIAFTLKITALMHQNAWDNSAEYYRCVLSVYHSYIERKNKTNLPALITVCNLFDRTFKEYERRIISSRQGADAMDATMGSGLRTAQGRGANDVIRSRAQLGALDEEIHALRTSFWSAAYTASSNMRHIPSSKGGQSGEQVHLTCKAKAFQIYGEFIGRGQEGHSEGVVSEKSDGKRFNMLAGLLRDLKSDLKKEETHCARSPSPATVSSLPSSFPIDRLLELGDTREEGVRHTIGIDVDYSKFAPEPVEVDLTPKPLKKNAIGRSQLVAASKSTWDKTDQDADAEEDNYYSPAMPDAPVRVEDFDTFGNNCRASAKELASQGSLNSISHHPTHTSSSGCTVLASTARRSEETVRRTLKRIVCRMAGGLYGEVHTEDLLKQLDDFLESTHRQSTFSKVENDKFVGELLCDILTASGFSPPLRAAYLFRPHTAESMPNDPMFFQHYVSALSPGPEDKPVCLKELSEKHALREAEGLETGELTQRNRFCNVRRLKAHIEAVNQLAARLQQWGVEKGINSDRHFLAAWIGSFVRPYHSEVHFNRYMERPLYDFDWCIAFEAAESVLNAQPVDMVNSAEVSHSLVRILCDHKNPDQESLKKAYDIVMEGNMGCHLSALPESYALITRCAIDVLSDLDLDFFIKPIEKFARVRYEYEDTPSMGGAPPLDNPEILRALLGAHGRLQHGHQCLLLLKRLRIIGATVDFNLIRRAAKTIAFAKRNKSQWPITCLTGRRGTDPGALCDFLLQEVRRGGFVVDHHAQIMTLLIRRTKMLAGRRFDSEEKTTEINKLLTYGVPVEVWKIPKAQFRAEATDMMLDAVNEFVDLESRDPEEMVKKPWMVRFMLSAHLSVQQMKQAHDIMRDLTGRYGLAPSTRYYDRFTRYFGVRGRVDRFNEILQMMINEGVEPSNMIAEHTLMCYIIAAHKGQSEVPVITDKVQEMYNAHRVRPSPTGMIRLIDYLLYIGDEQEARRAVVLINQLFTEREREVELHWPSLYTPEAFFDGTTGRNQFAKIFPAKGAVYENGLVRGEAGVLTTQSLQKRFERAGFAL